MTSYAIVGFYLGVNALFFIFLSFKVIGLRQNNQASIGDGDNETLAYRIRAHGNAAEYMPIFFIALSLAAHLGTPPLALHILGVVFTAGRFFHAIWFLKPSLNIKMRIAGMLLTFSAIGLTALGLLAHGIVIMAGGY